ncbi:MAG: hypothetical protein J5570_02110 [Lachnospiraceae bacterium]|nr:hypothetical protein [Lachnospiraceae bacterium]
MNPSVSDKKSRPVSYHLPILGFALALSYFMYETVMHALPGVMNDYNGHVYNYLATFTGGNPFKAWMMSPYFLWHSVALFFRLVMKLPIEESAAASSCLFYLASYFVTVFMTEKWCAHKDIKVSAAFTGFFSFALTMLQPIWIPFLDAGVSRGLGAFSINPLYNPTHMAARPFALLCFMLLCDLWELEGSRKSVFFGLSKKKTLILLAIVLFISATAKPVFAEMFIPAVGIVMLFRCRSVKYLKENLLPAFASSLSTVIYILIMYLLYVKLGGSYADSEGAVITPFLQVWSYFSENIPLSIVFMMSFPIYILVIDCKNYLSSNIGKLGTVSFAVGFLEAAFLGEGGEKLYHGNFIWPMMFGALLLWASSMLHFLTLDKKASTRFTRILICIGWILILIHVHYGFQYLFESFEWNFMI